MGKEPFETPVHLRSKTVKAGAWSLAETGVARALGFAQTLILARLLAPDDFGLFGSALLVLYILDTFAKTGFETALVQNAGKIDHYLDTAWTIQVIRGFVLAIAMTIVSPIAGLFFSEPEIIPIILVLGLSVALRGFDNIAVVELKRNLEFRGIFQMEMISALVSFAVTLVFALALRNAWALVASRITWTVVHVVASYRIRPYRPSLQINRLLLSNLLGFGKWITGTSILKLLILQGDDLFVARVLGTESLGLYQMAYRISQAPATEISSVINRAAFPAYSRIQFDLERLKGAWLRTLQISQSLTVPVAGGILAIAADFTKVVLGTGWLEIIPVMQVLAVLGAIKTFNFAALLNSVGKPEQVTKFSALRLVLMVLLILPLTSAYGLVGTALSVLLASVFVFPFPLAASLGSVNSTLKELLRIISPPWISTIVMVGVLLSFREAYGEANLATLVAEILLGLATYCLILFLLDLASGSSIRKIMQETVAQLRNK